MELHEADGGEAWGTDVAGGAAQRSALGRGLDSVGRVRGCSAWNCDGGEMNGLAGGPERRPWLRGSCLPSDAGM